MKSITSIAIRASMLAALTVAAGVAQAATWVDVGPASGFSIESSTVTYSPSPALTVKYYNDNLVPQSPADIQAYINGVFGTSLGAAVSFCDNATSGCTAGTTAGASGGVNSFTSAAAYDYLAIHFGQGELVFQWAAPVAAGTTFTVSGLPKDLSNYRAYVSAIPEPETYAMLLAGLGLLGLIARRRQAR
ncbi:MULTISPECIES: PEP-CTERM sorting domain-containing protein [Janthinobacterium]|uniref:PEP-CTERM sorting domain-containing protein n=1 Tax=Janthinobacterium violaceinigrum TaxID=2654252 RepID=A0A6I1I0W9_9BURK|nr:MULTISPECIES: PEP-CTERM sorting domain-containing protein [Janthinobacterium]KAB8058541.1 PEP-CTERM sorting domain-containing protein [Janthinobacterium violaceinigrum]MED5596612.1 PEP-CTERM sorting domain-containing protein [Janthinobacterium sp. P210006]